MEEDVQVEPERAMSSGSLTGKPTREPSIAEQRTRRFLHMVEVWLLPHSELVRSPAICCFHQSPSLAPLSHCKLLLYPITKAADTIRKCWGCPVEATSQLGEGICLLQRLRREVRSSKHSRMFYGTWQDTEVVVKQQVVRPEPTDNGAWRGAPARDLDGQEGRPGAASNATSQFDWLEQQVGYPGTGILKPTNMRPG
jgi:hypothetical protein